jgi:hypothetical protein
MKKLIAFLFIVYLFIQCSDNKEVEKTVIGMFTPYTYFPETVNKKVREVKETNYLPLIKEGRIEAGKPLTNADRDSLKWTNDFTVQFNESGFAEKEFDLDEKGKITGSWVFEVGSDFYKTAHRTINESAVILERVKKLNNNIFQFDIIDPQTDTLRSKIVVEFGKKNKYKQLQWYNYKGEPTVKYDYSHDSEGHLIGFTVSINDTIRSGMNFTINENGFFETQEVYDKIKRTSLLTSYEYEYDNAGNWIKNVSNVDGKPHIVTLREYTYY